MNAIKIKLRNKKFFPLGICAKGHHRIINILKEDLND